MVDEVKKVLDKKVGEITLVDGALIGVSKLASESLLAKVPFIGNGTLRSSGVKVGSAIIVSMVTKNKYAKILSTGLLIDGMEDLALSVKRMISVKYGGNEDAQTGDVSAFN